MAFSCRAATSVCGRTLGMLTLGPCLEGTFVYASKRFSPKELAESCCAFVCTQRMALVLAKDLSPVCRIVKFHQPPDRFEHAGLQMRARLFSGWRSNETNANWKRLAGLVEPHRRLPYLSRLGMRKTLTAHDGGILGIVRDCKRHLLICTDGCLCGLDAEARDAPGKR